MRFQIPQFIKTEIKIVGPFTLKQFMWIGAGGSLIFLDFSVSHSYWTVVVAIPIAAVSLAFAFLKIDDIPLLNYISNALAYSFGQKQYIYRQDAPPSSQLPSETIHMQK